MINIERTWTVNGQRRSVSFAPLARLLDVLREELGLLGLKEGCGEGECGACSLLLNGELNVSCLVAAAQVDDGAEILTAEGLDDHDLGRVLKQTFDADGAVQCGYCSPGMLVGGYALLSRSPHASEQQIRVALAGNLCRCTGYSRIVSAVQDAAATVQPREEQP